MGPLPFQRIGQVTLKLPPTLSSVERTSVEEWVSCAHRIGIDSVEDLRARPWPVPIESHVLGVYRSGERLASWLLVEQDGHWAVALCAANSIVGATDSRAEALRLILRLGAV